MDPFLSEIRMFGLNFAPRGWALCNGQLLSIAQNTALFSLLGTQYGGNGQTTFALPNLQGKVALGFGAAPGLTQRSIGEIGGASSVTLSINEMAAHSHSLMAKASGGKADPLNNIFGTAGSQLPAPNYYSNAQGTPVQMNPAILANAGGTQPHNNLMPYAVLTFCIALEGIYPARN